ncbi:MAG: hypothetical protein HRF50_00510 [Phycisphaerae bacterium]
MPRAREIVDALTRLAESLVDPVRSGCLEIQGLARLFMGLRRIPAATDGVGVVICASLRVGNELNYRDLELTWERLRLRRGGSVCDPQIGSDSFFNDVLVIWS